MSTFRFIRVIGFASLLFISVLPAYAGPVLYYAEKDDSWFGVGLLVEVQYRYDDPDGAPGTDLVFFRRLRPTFAGGLNKDWQGILQLDYGAGQNGDAYVRTIRWVNFQYTGIERAHLTFGSFKHYFSREFITLGPHLQQIERTFLGENTYGNPAYTIGVSWDHQVANDKVFYAFSLGAQNHETQADEMSFKSPPNTTQTQSNQGYALAGRIDYYPMGAMSWDVKPLKQPEIYDRANFHTPYWRVMMSIGAYTWWNDGDNNTYTQDGVSTDSTNADLDAAHGVEVSGGVRGFGFAADLEYQFVTGDLIDTGFMGGLYRNGTTDLSKFGVNAGYMIFRNQVELLGAWAFLDADNYDKMATISTIGLNWFAYEKYAIRFAANYTLRQNQDGVDGQDEGIVRVQAQLAW